jgi:signal transduction histidine kinase/CheY-like chemotaxis protein
MKLDIGIASLLLLLSLAPAVAAEEVRERNVLLLNSYHIGYRWTDTLTEAVREVLSQRPENRLYIEHMDRKRWFDQGTVEHLVELLRWKYTGSGSSVRRLDAILAADDDALDLVLAYRDTLFREVPIVFCGINDFQPERIAGFGDITGVIEDYDFAGTLLTILKLHPDTRRFLAIGDDTRPGRAAMERFRRAAGEVETSALFGYLDSPTLEELRSSLSRLEPGTIVLYVAFSRTGDGVALSLDESRKLVADASPAPVYCFWDFYPGSGIVGGRGFSAENQGRAAARIIQRILDGEGAGWIPVVRNQPNPYVFDFAPLARFKIDEDALPEDSLVVNRPETFYSKHGVWLWSIAAFLALEAALVVAFLRGKKKRRLLEQQLRHSQKMEALGQLAGGIAHAFRNLLTVIGGHCELLAEQCDSGSDTYARLAKIEQAVEQASVLTRHLLAFSRKEVLQPKVLNLNTVVGEMAETLRRIMGEQIKLQFVPAQTLPNTRADRQFLDQAVLNLVTNARDAMPRGGTLTIRTRIAAVEEIRDAGGLVPTETPYVCLDVEDTGHGMATEVRERAFDPFFTTKDVGKGTGLGLPMVRGFVEQSGGGITFRTEPGKGTLFSLFLPAVDQPVEVLETPRRSPTQTPRSQVGETLLVVEDEPALLELMENTLNQRGYRVIPAGTPEEALRAMEQRDWKVALLVSDVIMPGMSGHQLAQRLRQHDPTLPVLLVSGYTARATQELPAALPGAEFLVKPFSPATLADTIRQMLDARTRENHKRTLPSSGETC